MNRYRIIHHIGSGSNGSVHKAEVKATKEVVALKKIDITNRTGSLLEYILSEGTMMKHLNRDRHHPNVARYIDSFQYKSGKKKYFVIVSDFIDGVDLDTYIEKHKNFPIDRVWEWMRQLASGVAFMHENDVVHRDLKPNNIMVDKELNLHIVDFGLSCFRPCEARSITEIIIPPERMEGYFDSYPDIQLTPMGSARALDIWALGITCYFLTNQATYPTGDKFDFPAITRMRFSQYQPSHRDNSDRFMVTVTNLLIMRMLEVNVNLRPGAKDIEEFISQEIFGLNVNGNVFNRVAITNMVFDQGLTLDPSTLYSLQTLYGMVIDGHQSRTALELDMLLSS